MPAVVFKFLHQAGHGTVYMAAAKAKPLTGTADVFLCLVVVVQVYRVAEALQGVCVAVLALPPNTPKPSKALKN